MCNLYSQTKGPQAIREFTRAMIDRTGNLPPTPGVYPDFLAPIVRNTSAGRELAMVRWGMPSPSNVLFEAAKKRAQKLEAKGGAVDFKALLAKEPDSGVTNIRNTKSPHWRKWLGVENRCVVPFTSFSEPEPQPDGKRPPAWFAFDESRPLAFFAGIWTPQWKSVRKVKEGETVNDLYAFLTTEPNKEVGVIHPKAMPAILTTQDEVDQWLTAPMEEALKLQRPLPDGSLVIISRGNKEDPPEAAPTSPQRSLF